MIFVIYFLKNTSAPNEISVYKPQIKRKHKLIKRKTNCNSFAYVSQSLPLALSLSTHFFNRRHHHYHRRRRRCYRGLWRREKEFNALKKKKKN